MRVFARIFYLYLSLKYSSIKSLRYLFDIPLCTRSFVFRSVLIASRILFVLGIGISGLSYQVQSHFICLSAGKIDVSFLFCAQFVKAHKPPQNSLQHADIKMSITEKIFHSRFFHIPQGKTVRADLPLFFTKRKRAVNLYGAGGFFAILGQLKADFGDFKLKD